MEDEGDKNRIRLMLAGLLVEITYKCAALLATVWVAEHLTSVYTEAVLEFTRAYITIIDLLYSEDRRPLRF